MDKDGTVATSHSGPYIEGRCRECHAAHTDCPKLTVATEDVERFSPGALRDALKIYEELAERSAFARKVLKQGGITPGLALDVWSHNVEHYAASVAGQLPILIASVEDDSNGK